MTDKLTTGEKLSALRARSGLTLAGVAQAGGYNGASSVQAYFSRDNDSPLSIPVAMRLASALAGRGTPPISSDEVMNLAEISPRGKVRSAMRINDLMFERIPNSEIMEPPTLRGQPRDVPVYGSALAADLKFDVNGDGPEPVEITDFAMGEVITYVRRPPGLDGQRKVYAIFVSGSSMEPRYRPGDPVFVDPQRPPSIGDDVIVQLRADDESGDIVSGLIKTLVRRTASHLELQQYEPAILFQVPTERIAHIHRVIPWRECFGM